MSQVDAPFTRSRRGESRSVRRSSPVTAKIFEEMFGEPLGGVMNPSGWTVGRDLATEYARIEREVQTATCEEAQVQETIREKLLPLLSRSGKDPLPAAGHFRATPEEIREIHDRLLFPGRVEAVDGTCEVYDSLPLTIYSLGISLVSYRGDGGTWGMKLFRRDLRQQHDDPLATALKLLERRDQREALNRESARDALSQFARRALMTYAERSVLVRQATAPWRLGHGNPCALELLAGGGCADLTIQSVRLLCELIQYRKFIFVASEPRDLLALTIGESLYPLEFAVIGRLSERLEPQIEQVSLGNEVTVDDTWDGERYGPQKWLERFTDDFASKVVYGVYRATRFAMPQLFYAHEDYVQDAARIVLADSVLQEMRGFPMLIDQADHHCRSIYGGGGLREMTDSAYARAGQPFRYQSERATRGSNQ